MRPSIRDLIITPFVAVAPHNFEICSCEEVDEVVQIPISSLMEKLVKTRHEGSTQQFYTYHYKGYTIWGITAWILNQFLNLISNDSKSNFG